MHPLFRFIIGSGTLVAWNGALWLAGLLFVVLPAKALFADALESPPPAQSLGTFGVILLIVAYFGVATPIGAVMAAHAVRCPAWLVGLVGTACFAVVVLGLYLVLATTAQLGGRAWVIASVAFMIALHTANLSMSALCSNVRELAAR